MAAPPVVPPAVEAPLTVSQLAELVAVNATEEAGEVVTLRDCVGGVAPLTELKVNEDGVGTRFAGGGVTVRFTAIVRGAVLVTFEAAV
jgi:hypothetical protein